LGRRRAAGLVVAADRPFAGIVYAAKGDERRQVGLVTIVLSCVAFLAWIALRSEPSTGYGY
jgi:hypothetical protein